MTLNNTFNFHSISNFYYMILLLFFGSTFGWILNKINYLLTPYFSISCSLNDHSRLSCSSIILFLFSRFSMSWRAGSVASLQWWVIKVVSLEISYVIQLYIAGYTACLSMHVSFMVCQLKKVALSYPYGYTVCSFTREKAVQHNLINNLQILPTKPV